MNAARPLARPDSAEADRAEAGSAVGEDGPADDAGVITRSRREPELFALLYERYFAEIYRYLAGRMGRDAADDLAADTFLAAFAARGKFDPGRGAVRPWLYGIATNLVRQRWRDEERGYRALARMTPEPAAADHQDGVAARVSAQQLHGCLASALAGLASGDRDVLLLTAVAGLSYDEVAVALSIPPGTVGSRLNRSRRCVRAALDRAGLYHGDPGLSSTGSEAVDGRV
jgi:RNA polymerase sigma factor (sigma-70 family)